MDLTKENSHTIGFIVDCLFYEAITIQELNRWADSILISEKDYPLYIVDLCTFNGYPKDIYKIIGFSPSTLTHDQKKAISGIAYLRGMASTYAMFKKETALKALDNHSEVINEFRTTFPFISIDSNNR